MREEFKIETNINYAKECFIRDFSIGQAFASADEVWIKISAEKCVVIGKQKFVSFTPRCQAFPITKMDVYL